MRNASATVTTRLIRSACTWRNGWSGQALRSADDIEADRRARLIQLVEASDWFLPALRAVRMPPVRALIGFAFGELGLNRLEADIDPRNLASARSLESLGFTREGLLRERWIVNGEVSDTALYGLLAREWPARS